MTQLNRFLSVAGSPWSWPIVPLLTVAAVGEWGNAIAAEVTAGAFCAVGIGVVIGLTAAGGRPGRQKPPADATSTPVSQVPATVPEAPRSPPPSVQRSTDLRGARLTNTTLVRADLRQADLRGAVLAGADLTGADLTDACLGPLDDEPGSNK